MDSPLNASAHTPKTLFAEIGSRVFSRGGLFVGLIFILAFIVRAHLMRYELFFEFDSYWHARMVSYILQGIPITGVDPLAYYQNVVAATFGSAPYLFWYVSAAIYKLFTLNAPYSLETWVLFVKILPALYGALISVAMYYLGKEFFKGPRAQAAGLFAGLFAAVVPAFVYRTMGGFFEDDSFGFLWMVIGLVFFVRAVRDPLWGKANILNAGLAGVCFALMAFTWSAFNMLVPILIGIGALQYLVWLNENEWEKAKHYGFLWLIVFVVMGIGATIQTGLFWLDQFGGILGTLFLGTSEIIHAPHVFVFLLVMLGLAALVRRLCKQGQINAKQLRLFYVIVILAITLSPLLAGFFNLSLRTGDVLGQSVGEESEGKNYFGNKYSMLILFALIGIPAMGYLLIRRTRHYEFLAVPLVWVVVTFFMAWGKLKFTYYWGLPLALTGCVVIMLALAWMRKQGPATQKFVALGVGMMVLMGIGAGTLFVTQNTPNIEITPEWKTALFWSEQNLPTNAKFFNWWDEGHWISFLTDRGVLIDNRNADTKATAKVAAFILSSDATEAWKIPDEFGSTHLIFGDDLLGKLPSLGFFAYNIQSSADPRIQGLFGGVMPCSVGIAPVTKEKKYQCSSNNLTEAQMQAYPTAWQSSPNGLQSGVPLYIYRTADNQKLFAFTEKANQTMIVRLWFDEPNATALFTPIYANDGVRIFQKNPLPAEITISSDANASESVSDVNGNAVLPN